MNKKKMKIQRKRGWPKKIQKTRAQRKKEYQLSPSGEVEPAKQ
jgi:hypothetical protein